MMPSEPKGTSFPVEAPVGKFAWPQEVIRGFPQRRCGGSVLTNTRKPGPAGPASGPRSPGRRACLSLPAPPSARLRFIVHPAVPVPLHLCWTWRAPSNAAASGSLSLWFSSKGCPIRVGWARTIWETTGKDPVGDCSRPARFVYRGGPRRTEACRGPVSQVCVRGGGMRFLPQVSWPSAPTL